MRPGIKQEFIKNASLVSAVIHEVNNSGDAFLKVIKFCNARQPRQDLLSRKKPYPIPNKIIAAPGLEVPLFEAFYQLCLENDIQLVKENLRHYPGGLDIGFSFCDYGIARTGTLVLNSDSEDKRLASMLCEVHFALLPLSKIRASAFDMTQELEQRMSKPSSYTSFITGASRTADIERVLAIGVHGPLELHIILLED